MVVLTKLWLENSWRSLSKTRQFPDKLEEPWWEAISSPLLSFLYLALAEKSDYLKGKKEKKRKKTEKEKRKTKIRVWIR